jgi:glycerate kinase
MHILIAPNAFKNSLNAQEVAIAIQKGLNLSSQHITSTCFPIADGGDGTAGLIIEKCNGKRVEVMVQDPLGRKISSSFGLVDEGKTAVIEMAEASGLKLLKNTELNPVKASSFGTGELMKAALDNGVTKIMIAMGGSATVDGGCGILSALGFTFLDVNDNILTAIPESLTAIHRIDNSNADQRLTGCEIVVLCDVDNSLLGPNGAAAVFGPQKGADAAAVNKLDHFLTRLTKIADQQFQKSMDTLKYGGTAGGAAAGLHVFLNATLTNGIDYFLNLTGFDAALKEADVLITGEGSIDLQTLQGKGPFGVASRAHTHNIPVIGLAGKIPAEPEAELIKYFNVLLAIGNEPADLPAALKNTEKNLIRTAASIGRLLQFSGSQPPK